MNIQPTFKQPFIATLLALVCATQAQAQLTSPLIGCGPVFAGSSFTVEFKGDTATLNYKDDVHTLKFVRQWQTTQGEKWVDYHNKELVLSTSWPGEPYVAISLQNAKNSVAACDVVEVKP
jgi:hypothetical protein